MITVTDYDCNGKPIDLTEVTINLAEYPAIVEALLTKEETA